MAERPPPHHQGRDPRSPGAAATRRWRERQTQGLRSVTVELRDSEIARLFSLGLLSGGAAGEPDRAALRAGLHKLFDRTLSNPRWRP